MVPKRTARQSSAAGKKGAGCRACKPPAGIPGNLKLLSFEDENVTQGLPPGKFQGTRPRHNAADETGR